MNEQNIHELVDHRYVVASGKVHEVVPEDSLDEQTRADITRDNAMLAPAHVVIVRDLETGERFQVIEGQREEIVTMIGPVPPATNSSIQPSKLNSRLA